MKFNRVILHHARLWTRSRLDFLWKPTPALKWLIEPPPLDGERVCLLASFTASGVVSRHTCYLAQQWRAQGFKVVLVMASDRATTLSATGLDSTQLDGLVLRRNSGYDFGSWSHLVRLRPDIRRAALLVMTNDSLYGPLRGFPELLSRVDASNADVVGMTDSYQVRHHVQSYMLFYRPHALASKAFKRIWSRTLRGERYEVIMRCEVPLLGRLKAGGLSVDVLFPSAPGSLLNPTIDDWRSLLDAGFPFIKAQLLRDKPLRQDLVDWDRALADHSYDPALVYEHLGERFAQSSAAATASKGFLARMQSGSSPACVPEAVGALYGQEPRH